MNPVNANKLLETMQNLINATQAPKPLEKASGDFDNILSNAIDKTNELSKTSKSLATRYEQGDPQVELVDVMIASQKSSVSFQALTQVRNRLVSAYQDIMNMAI